MKINIWGLIRNIWFGKKKEREGGLDMLINVFEQIETKYQKCISVEDKAELLDGIIDFLCIIRKESK